MSGSRLQCTDKREELAFFGPCFPYRVLEAISACLWEWCPWVPMRMDGELVTRKQEAEKRQVRTER